MLLESSRSQLVVFFILLIAQARYTVAQSASSGAMNQSHGCTSFMRGRSTNDPHTMISVTTCSGLGLSSVPRSVADATAVLQFDRNALGYVHEDTLLRFDNLEQLDLSSNQITAVLRHAFDANRLLTDLTLGDNRLETLPVGVFDRLSNLKSLNVSFNLLTAVRNDTFSVLRTLILLDLSGNKISLIEPAAFSNLYMLRELILVRNQLQTLPAAMETLMPLDLRMIRLGFNNWRCDCHLLWLKQFLLGSGSRSPVHYDKDAVVCLYGTEAVKTRALQYIAFTQMVCAPEIYTPRRGTIVRVKTAPGTDVRFECGLSVVPKREVTWLKDDEPVNTRTYFEATRFAADMTAGNNFTALLNITRVDYSDAGNYACYFGNEAGSVVGNFTLEVAMQEVSELTADEADRSVRRNDEENMAAFVTSWFKNWSTFFIVLVAIGGACIVVFIVSTIVYCLRTAGHAKRQKRQKSSNKTGQTNSKYGQLQLDMNHDANNMRIDALSAQSASKFNEDAASDNLLVGNSNDPSVSSRTLMRVGPAKQFQLSGCNNNDMMSTDANGSPTLPAPPPYNPITVDEFGATNFDVSQCTTPSMQRYGTQPRVQFQHDTHFCPVHGSKPAAMVQPLGNGMVTINPHHVHQPTCPMFSVIVGAQPGGANISPYGTIRRQPCPLHGCAIDGAHIHQEELAAFQAANFIAQPQFVNVPVDAPNGVPLVPANGSTNTYMKALQVDDCVRDNMDDSTLRAYGTNLVLQNDGLSKKIGRVAGIEEEGESDALSTVV